MFKLLIDKQNLSDRQADISKNLKVLLSSGTYISPTFTSDEAIFRVISPSRRDLVGGEEKFTLYKRAFSGRYKEVWKKEDQRTYYLYMASLEIYAPPTENSWPEILALHCDPCEIKKDKHLKYKRSPHMHISASIDPFPLAHISLYLDREVDVYETLESFNRYLKRYSILIKEQFMDIIDESFSIKMERSRARQ